MSAVEDDVPAVAKTRVMTRAMLKSLRRHPLGLCGAVTVLLMALFCFVGPLLRPTDQTHVNILDASLPPNAAHPLGTDTNGFDVLGRLMLGGQTSFEIGLLAAVIATAVGTLYGAAAGLIGGVFDGILMRLVDVMLAVPFLFFVLILSARFHAGPVALAVVIGAFSWLMPARLIRGEVLALRVREFVLASRVMGASRTRLVLRHLIPNSIGVIIVNVTFQVADSILTVAVLGFLGFGLNYPSTDWGSQLGNGVTYISAGYPWLVYPVGVCIIITVVALNLVADALRDATTRAAS